jgi:hypothetical protein
MRFRKSKTFDVEKNQTIFKLDTKLSDGRYLSIGYLDEQKEPEYLDILTKEANGLTMQAPESTSGYDCTFID